MNNPPPDIRVWPRPKSDLSSASLQAVGNRLSQKNLDNNFSRYTSDQQQNHPCLNENLNAPNMSHNFINRPPPFGNFSPDPRSRPPPPILTPSNLSDFQFSSFRLPPPPIGIPAPVRLPNFPVGTPSLSASISSSSNQELSNRSSQPNFQSNPRPIYTPQVLGRPLMAQHFSPPPRISSTQILPPSNLVLPPIFSPSPTLAATPNLAPPPVLIDVNQVVTSSYLAPPPISALQTLNTFDARQITHFPPPNLLHNSHYVFQSEIPSTQEAYSKTEQNIEDADKDWIHMWISKKKFSKIKPVVPEMTVKQAKVSLKESLETLGDLRAAIGFLSRSLQADDPMWSFKLSKAIKAKEKLISLRSQFNPTASHFLKIRLKKISNKRSRLRRRQLHVEETKKISIQERELLHQEIDAWRKGIQNKVLEQKKKEELKHEADNILSEVRKKLQEGRKVLEHLDLLENLRSVRNENSEKKGLKVSGDSTERFEATVMKLRELMTRQLSVYEAEERALKVMLETEREQERYDEQKRKLDAFDNCQKEAILRLFGTPPDSTSPLYFYWQFHMQGSSNIDALIQIR